MKRSSIEELELVFGSEFPTERAPELAQAAARDAAQARREAEGFCDSEAPTGVAVERPLLPPPPRAPRV